MDQSSFKDIRKTKIRIIVVAKLHIFTAIIANSTIVVLIFSNKSSIHILQMEGKSFYLLVNTILFIS